MAGMDAAVAAASIDVPPAGGPSARQYAVARWGLELHFFIVVNLLDQVMPARAKPRGAGVRAQC